jgi:hypothetical protein
MQKIVDRLDFMIGPATAVLCRVEQWFILAEAKCGADGPFVLTKTDGRRAGWQKNNHPGKPIASPARAAAAPARSLFFGG